MMLKQALQQKCVITLYEKQKKNTQRMARSQTGSTTRSKTGDLTKKGFKTGLCIHRGLLRMKKVKVQEQVIKQK